MKLLSLAITALLAMALTTGCNPKKDDEPTGPSVDNVFTISNKTGTGFTVTWHAASDDATPAEELQYKLVSSTSDNISTAADAEANGTTVLDWTANTLTASLSSLTPSTFYYLALLVRDADSRITLQAKSVSTLCTGKRVFLVAAANGNLGGKAGADSKCNTAAGTAAGTYKAMLSDITGYSGTGVPPAGVRQACDDSANCTSSTLYELDWVLATNRTYCTSDYESKLGSTGGTYKVMTIPVGNILSATPVNLFTGMNMAWGVSVGNNCSNWSSTSGTYVGGTSAGVFSSGGYNFIASFPFPNCSDPGAIVCVEQ